MIQSLLLLALVMPLLPQRQTPSRASGTGGTFIEEAQPHPKPGPLDIAGTLSGIRQARKVVVRDANAWETLWKEHAPGMTAPVVDFKRRDVVGVFAGQRPTGGYVVKIDKVGVRGKTATVDATVLKPPRGSIVTQMITYPFAMRAVPKPPKDVQFRVREAERT